MHKIKVLFFSLVSNKFVMAVAHTFWQAAGGVLVASLFAAHSTADVKGAIAVAVATGLAAVKNTYVAKSN